MSLAFALSGATQASWMSRLPAILEQTDTNLVQLGLALLMLGLGTLAAMLLTGAACARYGSRRVLTVGFVITLLAVVAIALSRTPAALTLVLLVVGLGSGIWDAGMNVQGYAVENGLRKHLMSHFHGWWSIGSMAGAGAGLAATRFAVPLPLHLAVYCVIAGVLCAASLSSFVSDFGAPPEEPRVRSPLPVRRLVTIGALMFCGAVVEGAAGDWLAVYLNEVRGLSHTGAAFGYALFVTAMAIGRLAAERPHRHIGAIGLVRGGAVLAGLCIGMVVLTTASPWAFVGALGWGVGICWVFPAALSATGTVASASAVGVMTAVGYSASIFGPLGIGALAHGTGLGTAMFTLLPLALVVAVLAPALVGAEPSGPE